MSHLSDEQQTDLRSVVTTTQIIMFALANGVFIFGVVVFFLKRNAPPQPGTITYLAAASALILIPLSFMMPRFAAAVTARASTLRPSLSQRFQISRILSGALLEAAAFFNLTAYLVECSRISLFVAGVLLALIVRLIPTHASALRWAEWDVD